MNILITGSNGFVGSRLMYYLEEKGLVISGLNLDLNLAEIVELKDHPFFLACQFHPEFTSTPRDGHPLFLGFVKAAIAQSGKGG